MKKIFFLNILLVCTAFILQAQVPEAISYQALARDAQGQILSNTNVSLQISIISGSVTGTSVYVERHNVTTNQFGMINLKIGTGTFVLGNFSQIDWSANQYFSKVEIDITNGTNFIEVGTSQILSVPYALHAKTAESADYNSLINLPNLFSGNFNDLSNKPTTVSGYGITDAFSGNYVDLTNKPTTIAGYGISDAFSGNYADLTNKPMEIIPRIAKQGQTVSVSFSGGDQVTFAQASSSCPLVYANAWLKFTQGTSTINIIPNDIYFINDKRFDAIFDIPYGITSGNYDIIIAPGTSCQQTLSGSFKIK